MNGVAQVRAFVRAGDRGRRTWSDRYITLFALGLLVVLAAPAVGRAVSGVPAGVDPARAGAGLALVALLLAGALVLARGLGPVAVSAADAAWLLLSPLPRRSVLTRTAVVLAALCTAFGAVLGLVLLGTAAGLLAQAARRWMLGPGLRDAALTLSPPPTAPAGALRRSVPAVCAALLLTVCVWGLTRDAMTVSVAERLAGPSWAHPLGTDAVGRDVLARLGHGAVATVGTAALVCLVSLAVALVVGFRPALAAGAADMANALPPVIAGILVAAVMGPGPLGASVAVALVSWPPLAAHAASLVQETRAAAYLDAQRALGADSRWILVRHVLPAVLGPV
ncbi:hypothetical protein Q7689_17140, partial [Nocardiopsis tropica]|nr:hypothetical protein [Nocardiopsis tropica]